MPSWRLRVLTAVTVGGLAVAALVGAPPASADPAPLPPPTVSATRVVAGATTVVSGTQCVDADGDGGVQVSTWLVDGPGETVGLRRTAESDADGTWSLRLTVPLAAPPYQTLYVRSSCGWSDFGGEYRLYPQREITPLPVTATPWKAQQPQLPAVPNGRLAAVSCLGAKSCVAVGSYRRAGVETPLVEVLDGRGWRVSPLPDLTDSRGASLTAVSCATTTSCTAVGRVTTSQGVRPLAVSSVGSTWQPTVLPVPDANPNVVDADLAGVSCAAAAQCVAVGRAGQLDSTVPFSQPAAYVLRGTSWTYDPPASAGADLDAVSCRSATACVAVQTPQVGTGDEVLVFDGSSWSAGPRPSDPQVRLTSVSCPANGLCVGVGFATDGRVDSVLQPWAGQLDVTGWATLALGDIGTGRLDRVSCATGTSCVVLGRRGTDIAPGPAFTARRSGASWTATTLADGATVSGVSCLRTAGCTAVGGQDGLPLGLTGTGTAWSRAAIPAPAGLPDGTFRAVDCVTDTACTVVGWYDDATGASRPMVDRWDGTAWTVQAVPDLPSGVLTGVSCPTTSACTAVGRTAADGPSPRTLLLQWTSGSGWRQVTAGAAATDGALEAVSCGSADTCLAVGSDPDGLPLTLVLRSGQWRRVATAPHGSLSQITMPSVSCVGAVCRTAVDGAVDSFTDASIGLRWNGSRWAADAQRPETVAATSCAAPGRCLQSLSGTDPPTVLRIVNATPTVEELPADDVQGGVASGLSCRDQLRCVGVGASAGGAFVTRWTGREWRLEPLAATVPHVGGLWGVSCAAGGGRCVAVGGGDDSPPTILVDDPGA